MLVVRVLQEFGFGGEWGAGAVLMGEISHLYLTTKGSILPGQCLAGLSFFHGPPHVLNGPVLACFDHAHP